MTCKNIAILLVMMVAFVQSGSSQTPVPQRIDSVMKVAYSRGIFNGNILVAQRGAIIYQGSFGYADGSRLNRLDSRLRFDIGSISKEFNGTSIMILVEKGLLQLDDPIRKHLGWLPAWAGKVKIRHLINYTSGIPLFTATASETDEDIRKNLSSLAQLSFEPGTAYIYNHYNVYLQERIIEKVSGMTYAAFLQKNIFAPCRMDSAIVDYPTTAAGMARSFNSEFKESVYAQGMTGWVRLPVMDLYRWTEQLHKYAVISERSLDTLAVAFSGGESSLGTTGFENQKMVWHQHQGSNSNYEALLYSDLEEGITIVMMTNNQQLKVHGIKSAILGVLRNTPFTIPLKSVYLEVREKLLADFEKGLAYYKGLKTDHRDQYDFSFEIGDLISSGKYLERRNQFDHAIRLFQMAVALEGKPADISYGYELIGQCYFKQDKKVEAVQFYRKALSVDPNNKNASGMIASIEGGKQAQQ